MGVHQVSGLVWESGGVGCWPVSTLSPRGVGSLGVDRAPVGGRVTVERCWGVVSLSTGPLGRAGSLSSPWQVQNVR